MKKFFFLFLILCSVPVLLMGQNMLTNPGFEDGDLDANGIPDTWIGYAQTGASLALINDAATAHTGNYWTKCTSTNGGFYLLYQNSSPAKEGDIWKFSSFIKDVSPANPGASFVALKISAKNSSGGNIQVWEVFQDSVTADWKEFINTQTMPAGTALIQAVIVVHGADGALEASYGLDDVKLELQPIVDESNLLVNPGFENGDVDANGIPDSWIGYAQTGASLQLVNDAATAHSGNYWTKCTSTNGGYYLLYQNSSPSKPGDVWDFSSYIKDVSPANPGASFVALKISAKNSTGGTFKAWEIFQDGVTSEWKKFSCVQTMPEGTAFIQVVLVVHGADGALEAAYGFDDARLELIYENPANTAGANLYVNPGFEEGDQDTSGVPDGWIGYAQTGAKIELIKDKLSALNGEYWAKCTSTNGGYTLLYQDKLATKPNDVWDFSSYIKDVSPAYPGACFAALKITAKNSTGGNIQAWEIFQDSVPSYWKKFSNIQTMPEGTAFIQAVLEVHGTDGALEATYGFDDVKLELTYDAPNIDLTNKLTNPGFEDGDADVNGIPDTWIGYAQTGASIQLVKDAATAYSGNYWTKCTSTNGGYYLLYQNSSPSKPGDVWEFSSFIKDVSPAYPGACFAALKVSAKNSTGGTFKAWEIFQDTVTSEWKKYSTVQTMPEGTAFIQVVLEVHGADGALEASYGFDNAKLELIYENPAATAGANLYANPGFEEGDQDTSGVPDGWIGYGQTGAKLELVKDKLSALNGDYWTKCTSTNGGYYLLYQDKLPTKQNDIWNFSSFIKDVSPAYPGACFAALKVTAKNSSGGNIEAWEVFQDSVPSYWKKFSMTQKMPEGTAFIQAVLEVHGADGALEAAYGFDDVKLELTFDAPVVDVTNLIANPGFEDGDVDANGIPDGWIGYAQTGASLQLVNDATTANGGNYWTKCTSTNGGYYLLYQNSSPSKPGDVWDFSSYIKDVSPAYPGACFVALKISAKNSAGGTFKAWEVFQDTVTNEWKKYSNIQTMPEGTAFVQVVLNVHGADGALEASYGFDDVRLQLLAESPQKSAELNWLANPGFEAGDQDANGVPDGWIGYAQTGAAMEFMKDASTANNGEYWAKCSTTYGKYYLLYQNTFPAREGEVWKFSAFMKDISTTFPGGYYAALKISAKNKSGATFIYYEEYQDSITSYWKKFSNIKKMPEGTAFIQAVLVVLGESGPAKGTYGFDDVSLEMVHEMKDNPGFEDGDTDANGIADSWLGGGSSAAAHVETVKDSIAHYGNYYSKVSVDDGNGWYVLYQQGFPAKAGETWSLNSFIKNIADSTGDFAYLKLSAKDTSGNNLEVWEVPQAGVGSKWKDYSLTAVMPEGTARIQPVLEVKKQTSDGIKTSYGFDDIRIMKLADPPVGIQENGEGIVDIYDLKQNYPNPFNPSTTIQYSVKEAGLVSLKIYNTIGQEVASLVNEYKKSGYHYINFNASNLASGVYIYQLRSGSNMLAKKMILLK
ncbi:MAG: T9SS type A sorting domain-containing protein [Ignavibacteria bacterium]|nr:T9SS type A sorting domain-containing protein [Ignavibacteria bacterium]